MHLPLWATLDSDTSACIGSISNTVLLNLTMFVRRVVSPGMIQVGLKENVAGSSSLMRSPYHALTESWRGWAGLSMA